MRWQDLAGVAVFIPIVSLLAVWAARKVGRWTVRALERSFAQVVLDVMSPDMAHLGKKLTTSIDELLVSNTADHAETGSRLAAMEARQSEVIARLDAVENAVGIRPTNTRTRTGDPAPIGE